MFNFILILFRLFIGSSLAEAFCPAAFTQAPYLISQQSRPFFKPEDLKTLERFFQTAPRTSASLAGGEKGRTWDNPLIVKTDIVTDFQQSTAQLLSVFSTGTPDETDKLLDILWSAQFDVLWHMAHHDASIKSYLEGQLIHSRIFLIRYYIDNNKKILGIPSHRDESDFQALVLVDKPKRGSGGNLLLDDARDFQNEIRYEKNRLVFFEGQRLYHQVTDFDLRTTLNSRRKYSERYMVGFFFSLPGPKIGGYRAVSSGSE